MNNYPWRRYNQFPPVPDFVDSDGRQYVVASTVVQEQFGKAPPIETLEIKLPKNRDLEFPERTITLMNWNDRRKGIRYLVDEVFFLPRGATGVVNIYKVKELRE